MTSEQRRGGRPPLGETTEIVQVKAPGELVAKFSAWCEGFGRFQVSRFLRLAMEIFVEAPIQIIRDALRIGEAEGCGAATVAVRWLSLGHDAAQLGQLRVAPPGGQEADVPDEKAREQIRELQAGQREIREEVREMRDLLVKITENHEKVAAKRKAKR